jgi:hypothetical protein
VLFGLSQLIALFKRWRQRAAEQEAPQKPSGSRRALRIGTRSVGLLVALALLGGSVALHSGDDDVPEFYDMPETVPKTPGQLLDTEPLDKELPDDAHGWRILYSTTSTLGEPAVGSAFVMAPEDPSSGSAPRHPVDAWHGRYRPAVCAVAPRHPSDWHPVDSPTAGQRLGDGGPRLCRDGH